MADHASPLLHSFKPDTTLLDMDKFLKDLTEETDTLIANCPKCTNDVDSIKATISYLVSIDQYIRSDRIIFRLHELTDEQSFIVAKLFRKVDTYVTETLKSILTQNYGWLTIDKFGIQIVSDAFTLLQHADLDIDFQERILTECKKLLPLGQVAPYHFAYLSDRVEKYRKGEQTYATQISIDIETGKLILYLKEGDTIEAINARRKTMGFCETIEDYLAGIKKEHNRDVKIVYGSEKSSLKP